MKKILIALGLLVFMLSACTVKTTDLTVVSIRDNDIPAKVIGTRVSGEHCVLSWLGINWFGGEPDLKLALEQAMYKAGPEYDALVAATITRKNGYWKNCYEVYGTAISTKK